MLMKTPASALPPTMESLVTVLRDRSLWPPGFEWNFRWCRTCALGLSEEIWGLDRSPISSIKSRQAYQAYAETFCHPVRQYKWGLIPWGTSHEATTPEVVADRIEKNFL